MSHHAWISADIGECHGAGLAIGATIGGGTDAGLAPKVACDKIMQHRSPVTAPYRSRHLSLDTQFVLPLSALRLFDPSRVNDAADPCWKSNHLDYSHPITLCYIYW